MELYKARCPTIDPEKTGSKIKQLRKEKGLSIRDLQEYFGFESPRAIYKWERGESLPNLDNVLALGKVLDARVEDILIERQDY